jgi:hypothetical protein
MEKLYVKEISPNGEVNTVGLFYSRAEAENIVAQLRNIAERAVYRYEIVQANQSYLVARDSNRSHDDADD